VEIKHYIISRINIGLYSTNPKRYLVTMDEKNTRMDLLFSYLEKNSIPSIASQTNKNFEWVWLIDDHSPDGVKERVKKLSNILKSTTIFDKWESKVPFGEGNSCGGNWLRQFRENFRPGGIVSITRYDIDDYISSNFIDVIQKHFEYREFCIDFENRISVDWKGEKYLTYNKPPSPIITLLEKTDKIKTPYYYPHYKLDSYYQMKILPDIVYAKTEKEPHPSIIQSKLKRTNIKNFEALGE